MLRLNSADLGILLLRRVDTRLGRMVMDGVKFEIEHSETFQHLSLSPYSLSLSPLSLHLFLPVQLSSLPFIRCPSAFGLETSDELNPQAKCKSPQAPFYRRQLKRPQNSAAFLCPLYDSFTPRKSRHGSRGSCRASNCIFFKPLP